MNFLVLHSQLNLIGELSRVLRGAYTTKASTDDRGVDTMVLDHAYCSAIGHHAAERHVTDTRTFRPLNYR